MDIAQKIAAIKHCYTSTTCVGCPANPTPDSCMPDKCLCNINDAVLEVLDKFDTKVHTEQEGCRYIDASILIDDLVQNRGFYPALVESAIKNTPTADVVAVKHGEWGFDGTGWTCSECDSYGDERYKYCPHCGAKMDGGTK